LAWSNIFEKETVYYLAKALMLVIKILFPVAAPPVIKSLNPNRYLGLGISNFKT